MSPRLANLFRATRAVRPRSPPVSYKRAYYVAAGLGAAVALPATLMAETVEEQLETSPRISNSLSSMSTSSIIRSYVVYTACSIPFLIDYAPTLLSTFTNSPIPGLSSLTHFIVRHTFFAQFVPGESVAECQPTMMALRSRNVGSLLNYSAEADENATDVRHLEKQRLDEIYRAIDAMGKFEDDVEAGGGKRGSSAFALKIVSST
jgi:proline dehydrogenase